MGNGCSLACFPLWHFILGNPGSTAGGLIYLCLFTGSELLAFLLSSPQMQRGGRDARSLERAEELAVLPSLPLQLTPGPSQPWGYLHSWEGPDLQK